MHDFGALRWAWDTIFMNGASQPHKPLSNRYRWHNHHLSEQLQPLCANVKAKIAVTDVVTDASETAVRIAWSGMKKQPKSKLLSPDIFRRGGVFHVKGWGPKSSVCLLKPGKSNFFWRDVPGFCRDIPGAPEKFEKKTFVFNSRLLHGALQRVTPKNCLVTLHGFMLAKAGDNCVITKMSTVSGAKHPQNETRLCGFSQNKPRQQC